MQFLVIAHDGDDDKAPERRAEMRPEHLALASKMKDEGHLLYAAAILDSKDTMVGSAMVLEFESRQKLDQWLENEPYVVGKVWQKIEVKACKVAPIFANLTKSI